VQLRFIHEAAPPWIKPSSLDFLFPNHVEGGLSRANSLSYDGARMDIGLGLTGWKAYEVSGVETFASRHICSKLLQTLARKDLVSPE
jgi:hypothetical protein